MQLTTGALCLLKFLSKMVIVGSGDVLFDGIDRD